MDALTMISGFFGVDWWCLVVICGLVFLAGYIDAIAGGGGLISLPAYLIAGLPTHIAIGTNKLGSAMGTAVATWHYARSGFINVKLAVPAIGCALVGSVLGSSLVLLVDDAILKVLLVAILPVTAFYVLRSKAFDASFDPLAFSLAKTMALCCLFAFAIGLYDGFYGPGTGTFLMLLLTGAAHLRLDAAAGVTKAINLTTNVSALLVFIVHGQVYVACGLLAGVFSIAGNYLGSHRFTDSGGSAAKPIIVCVLAVLLVKVIYDLVA